jgi:hypothetical protein
MADDDDCFSPTVATPPTCNCENHKSGIDRLAEAKTALLNKMRSDPTARQELERDFFWDFLEDQYAQTQCEKNMLTNLDLLPNEGQCPEDVNSLSIKENLQRIDAKLKAAPNLKVSPDALEIQKTILSHMLQNLPDLAKHDTACKDSTSRAEKMRLISNRSTFGNHGETVGSMSGIYDSQIDEAFKTAVSECSQFKAVSSRIWSSETPEMKKFLRTWIDRYEKAPGLKNDKSDTAFKDFTNRAMSEVLPILASGRLLYGGDIDWSKTFQGAVLNPMICESKHRQKILSKQMTRDGSSPLPGTFTAKPETGAEIKKILMKDQGQAALAFMQRTEKYKPLGSELPCRIENEYYVIPNRIKNARRIVIGGVTALVTAGAATGVEGLLVLGLIADSATAIDAAHEAFKTCGESMYSLGSLQTQPVCQLFQGPAKTVVSNLTSRLEKYECNEAVVEAFIATAGVGISAYQAIPAIRRLGSDAPLLNRAAKPIREIQPVAKVEEFPKMKNRLPEQPAVNTKILFTANGKAPSKPDIAEYFASDPNGLYIGISRSPSKKKGSKFLPISQRTNDGHVYGAIPNGKGDWYRFDGNLSTLSTKVKETATPFDGGAIFKIEGVPKEYVDQVRNSFANQKQFYGSFGCADGARCVLKNLGNLSLPEEDWYTRKTVSDTLEKLLKNGFFGPDGTNYKVSVYLTPRQSLERIADGANKSDKVTTGIALVIATEGAVIGATAGTLVFVSAKHALSPTLAPPAK